jgi:hypothetical protein
METLRIIPSLSALILTGLWLIKGMKWLEKHISFEAWHPWQQYLFFLAVRILLPLLPWALMILYFNLFTVGIPWKHMTAWTDQNTVIWRVGIIISSLGYAAILFLLDSRSSALFREWGTFPKKWFVVVTNVLLFHWWLALIILYLIIVVLSFNGPFQV